MSLSLGYKHMNNIQKAKAFIKRHVVGIGASVATATFAVANFASAQTAPTADPGIATTATQVGGQLQANIVSALTTILPYVLAVVGIFLAVRLGMRWLKKSAH
jgi:hypothetical protein